MGCLQAARYIVANAAQRDAAVGDGLQRITDVTVSRTTKSGRVGELRIVFERGDIRIPGPDVRSVLRPDADRLLSSAAFQLTVTKAGGQVTRLVAAVRDRDTRWACASGERSAEHVRARIIGRF